MNEPRIRADSFVLKSRRIWIYRVRHRGGATVLWTSATDALRYLKGIQRQRLQAKSKGR
ncbi:MAG: hypothetical protein WDO70_06045 [Alphaproteobacteria bacterium]